MIFKGFKPLVVLIFVLVGASVQAQNNTFSPYSYSGLGQLRSKAFVHQQFMGGVTRSYRDVGSFALSNPASLTELKYTALDIGASFSFVEQSSSEATNYFRTGKLDYFAMGIPLFEDKKMGFSFSLSPFSHVGYLLQDYVQEDSADALLSFEGSGGINTAQLGYGAEVFKGFSLGASVDFIFGNISDVRDKQYILNSDYFSFRDQVDAYYQGTRFNFGVQYTSQIGEKFEQTIGATYAQGTDLNTTDSRTIRSYNAVGDYFIDTILHTNNTEGSVNLPSEFGLAYSIGIPNKWMNSVEYSKEGWSSFKDIRGEGGYNDRETYSFGGYYQHKLPLERTSSKSERYRSYLSTIRYYYGVNLTKGYVSFFDQQIDELGMGFGLGIPLTKEYRTADGLKIKVVSRLNLGLNYVQRGTTDNNLIEERYFEIKAGLALSDKWFNKRKYQ